MKISDEVLTVLRRGTWSGAGVVYFLPVGQLDRKLYMAVNKVLEAAGGKWDRKCKGHVFSSAAGRDSFKDIFASGEVRTAQEDGFFRTPAAVVQRMIRAAKIKPGLTYLEPSAGDGAIAGELTKLQPEQVTCAELHEGRAQSLYRFNVNVKQCDFLRSNPEFGKSSLRYDRILMNPPFAKQADIDHVTHALKFLAPGGVLVTLMSAGAKFRTNSKTHKFWELLGNYSYSVSDLPEKSFAESGTTVNAIMLTVECGKQTGGAAMGLTNSKKNGNVQKVSKAELSKYWVRLNKYWQRWLADRMHARTVSKTLEEQAKNFGEQAYKKTHDLYVRYAGKVPPDLDLSESFIKKMDQSLKLGNTGSAKQPGKHPKETKKMAKKAMAKPTVAKKVMTVAKAAPKAATTGIPFEDDGSVDIDKLTREQLKLVIKDYELGIIVNKGMTDGDIRDKINESMAGSPEAEAEAEAEPEAEPEAEAEAEADVSEAEPAAEADVSEAEPEAEADVSELADALAEALIRKLRTMLAKL